MGENPYEAPKETSHSPQPDKKPAGCWSYLAWIAFIPAAFVTYVAMLELHRPLMHGDDPHIEYLGLTCVLSIGIGLIAALGAWTLVRRYS